MPAAKNIIAGIGAVGLFAGAVIIGGTKGDGELEPVDGGVIQPVQTEKRIEDIAPVAVVSASGKKVFVVGEARPENPAVTESDLGKVVLKNEVSDSALCNVVFEAKLTRKTSPMPHGTHEYDEPDFAVDFGRVKPVMVPSSCNAEKYCIWNVLLHGQECVKAPDLPGYLGSTMNEFLTLPIETQARFLKQYGKCTVNLHGEMREIGCHVPIGDPRAEKDAEVVFPHQFAGRMDINYMNAKIENGKPVAVDRADVAMGTAVDNRGIPTTK